MKWVRNIAILVVGLAIAWFTVELIQPSDVTENKANKNALSATFERAALEIETREGTHAFDIELALDQPQQRQGLMFRREMAANAGMLFFHGEDVVAAMWMRNTYLPLDMLFVAADGKIVHIVERTVPESLTTVTAGIPVRAVLELNAGTVNRLAIKSGDRLIHPLFESAE